MNCNRQWIVDAPFITIGILKVSICIITEWSILLRNTAVCSTIINGLNVFGSCNLPLAVIFIGKCRADLFIAILHSV
jgi:hypothetical protein